MQRQRGRRRGGGCIYYDVKALGWRWMGVLIPLVRSCQDRIEITLSFFWAPFSLQCYFIPPKK